MKLPKPKIYKSIFQARYKSDLRFYDLLMPAAKKLGHFEHWQTNRLNVTLRDYDNHSSFVIDFQSFGYEQDFGKLDVEQENVNRAIDILPSALELESFTRLGLRRFYIIPVPMGFESLVTVLNVKLFSQSEKLKTIIPYKIHDIMSVQEFKDGDFMYRIMIGPLNKAEVEQYVPFNKEQHLKPDEASKLYLGIAEKYPDVSVLIDIDFSQATENLPIKEATNFIETARARHAEAITGLTEYLFTRDIEG